ncbi:MAG: hypothetical protein Q7R48_01610 [bacterium]|nr:hypothetical protein [bacterium]
MTPNDRTEELVDRVIEALFDQKAPDIRTLVVHRWPDTDAWLCLWMAKRFIRKTAAAEIVFVNSGEALPGSENDPSVLHFDTGGGPYDQHGKSAGRTSSAMLLAQRQEIQNDPGLMTLLELTVMVDNVEPIAPTNLHYIIEGLPRIHRGADNQIDWIMAQKTVFDMFDIVYGQETGRQRSRDDLTKFGEFHTIPNGLRLAILLGQPRLREAAFERGCDVVVWTEPKKGHSFYAGVQTNRQSPWVKLTDVAANLRKAEAQIRGISLEAPDSVGQGEGTEWFLHDSHRFVSCGTRTHELTEEQRTKLTAQQICQIVGKTLEQMTPPDDRGRRRR